MATALPPKLPLPPLHPPLPSPHLTPTPNTNKPTTTSRQPHLPSSDTQRWHHLTTRTPPVHPFIYAVLTTKIYCLPTCPSRLARRANIIFFSTPTEASKGGFRACKRCKPDSSPSFTSRKASGIVSTTSSSDDVDSKSVSLDPAAVQTSETSSPSTNYDAMNYDPTDPTLPLHKSLHLIQQHASRGERISLADLAEKVGLSKWHLQRAFKRKIGLSPREVGEGLLRERERREREEAGEEREGEDTSAGMGTGMGIGYDTPLPLPFPFTSQTSQTDAILSSNIDTQMPDMNMELTAPNIWANSGMDAGTAGDLGPFDPPLLITGDLTESLSSHATTPTPMATPAASSGSITFSPLNAGLSYSDMVDFDVADSSFYPDGFGPDAEHELYDLFREIYEKGSDGHEKQSFTGM